MKGIASVVLPVVMVAFVACMFPSGAAAADAPGDRVLAMYFHRTQRCPTCLKMGAYSEEAVKTGFAKQIKDGTVAFYLVDFQDPRNAALAKGYGITGPALIVARVVDNRVVKYANLEDIWTHVGNKPAFVKYVQANIAALAGGTAVSRR